MGYNKITLHGGTICDYLYVQSDNNVIALGDLGVNSEPNSWSDNTLLFSKFNHSLSAGNNELKTGIKGYEIRRKKGLSPYNEYVGTIKNASQEFIIDYLACNNTEYTYYLYPLSSDGAGDILLSPQLSNEITPDWSYWSLLVVDETDEENVFYLNKLFKFELNLSVDDMNNNAQVSITHNFTKYPTVQYSPSNFWSGSLSSLCGYISCNNGNYIETPNMIEELKQLSIDTRRKFLKDMDGNVWEVKITSPITVSKFDQSINNVKSVKLSWTEVGEVSNISVINNPNIATTTWVLTETGEAVPYMNYVWEDDSKWDGSKVWTGRDDILDTEKSNMGRDLFSKEGDV